MTGMRASTSVWVMLCIASVCAVAGVAALEAGVAESTMFYLFLGLFALYCVFMAVSWHRRRLLWWPIERRLLGLPDRREHAQRPVEERRRVADRRGGA